MFNMNAKGKCGYKMPGIFFQDDLTSPQLAKQVFDFYRLNAQEAQANLLKAFFTRIGINFE